MVLYVLFTCMLVMTAVIDSLEAAFSKEVLHLSNSTYGYLVSIAGAGFVLGSLLNAALSHKFHHMHLMGVGSVVVSLGYIIYAFSHDFVTVAIGFALIILCAWPLLQRDSKPFIKNISPLKSWDG